MFEKEIEFIRSLYPNQEIIPLHEPLMGSREKELVRETIDSGYVSSVGAFVDRFESMVCDYTESRFAVATVNGTSALHAALLVAGVKFGEEVLTQPLTFIATANAIQYACADPVFLDVDMDTLGLSHEGLEAFLGDHGVMKAGHTYNKKTGKRIAACLPVHIFGHPCRMDKIVDICNAHGISVIEDSAEAMGTRYRGIHAGRFGKMGIFSFNGNKIITAGGGGAIITDDEEMAKTARHMTTTARCKDPLEFIHDMVGYNYRMPNLNAALACAQMEQLDGFLAKKRDLARKYEHFFSSSSMAFIKEPAHSESNFWLNSVIAETKNIRNIFLKELGENGILARPMWQMINDSPMYGHCQTDSLETARFLANRVVSLPSSVPR